MKNEIPLPDHLGSKLTTTVCGAGRSMDVRIGTVSHRHDHDLLSVVSVCAQAQRLKRKRNTGVDETVERGDLSN